MNILALQIAQIVTAILVIIAVLLQPKGDQLSGSSAFGGMSGGESFKSRRGLERVLHYATIALTVILVILSLLLVQQS